MTERQLKSLYRNLHLYLQEDAPHELQASITFLLAQLEYKLKSDFNILIRIHNNKLLFYEAG